MSDNITHDLDLLDDWLAGKGYGEEAGLVLRTLTLIHKQADEIEKLRAALAPFVDAGHFKVITNVGTTEEYNQVSISVRENKLRAAAAALKETDNE